MPGIGLIANPRSRANLKDPSRPRKLGYLIGAQGTGEATQSIDDLYRVCEEFKKERIDILGISGGDGTLHHTLTAMIKTYGEEPLPYVAILRGGTMNTVANSLDIAGNPPQLLYELVDKHRRGIWEQLPVVERPLLRVGDQYGFIFGNGVIYNFLKEYYGTGHPSPMVAAQLIAGVAASSIIGGSLGKKVYRRIKVQVEADGVTWAQQDFMAIAASVVEQAGLGFRPFYRCAEKPGSFALLGIHTNAFGFVSELPRMHRGKPMRRDKVVDAVAARVVFRSLDGNPLDYIIDGDTYEGPAELVLETGPTLRFLRLTGDAVGETILPDSA